MSLNFDNMEKMRQFFEREENKNKEKEKTPNRDQLAERRQRLAERRQDLAERKQAQREREQQQRQDPEQKKEKSGSGALLFCVLGFIAILVEVIFCLCILCKY